MNRLAKALMSLCAALLLSTAAGAQIVIPNGGSSGGPPAPAPANSGGLITKITPQQVVPLITNAVSGVKISPQIKPGDNNTAVVTFPVWGDQVYSGISVENCEKDNSGCYVLEFFANFGQQSTINAAWMNAWNGQFYATRVYSLASGEVVFSADLMILSGVTPNYITGFAGFFKKVVDESSTFKPSSK